MSDVDEKRSRFKIVLDFLKRLLGKKPAPPADPYAYAMAPCVVAQRVVAAQRSPKSKTIRTSASLPAAADSGLRGRIFVIRSEAQHLRKSG